MVMSEDVSRNVRHALRITTGIWISTVAAVQQSLKTVRKMEFWNWNNLVISRGEFTFDLMRRSFTVIGPRLSSWIWIRLAFLWWKCCFKMVKIHILCIELRVVCTLTAVPNTRWIGVSALQHGPVLNHPLWLCYDLTNFWIDKPFFLKFCIIPIFF